MKLIELHEIRRPAPSGPVFLIEQDTVSAQFALTRVPPPYVSRLPTPVGRQRVKHPRLQFDKGLQIDLLA